MSPEQETTQGGGMNARQISEIAKKKIAEALDKKAESAVSVFKEGNNWSVDIEVLDEQYLPEQKIKSMNDIIGIYEVKLDSKGELISWVKKSSRQRGNVGKSSLSKI